MPRINRSIIDRRMREIIASERNVSLGDVRIDDQLRSKWNFTNMSLMALEDDIEQKFVNGHKPYKSI